MHNRPRPEEGGTDQITRRLFLLIDNDWLVRMSKHVSIDIKHFIICSVIYSSIAFMSKEHHLKWIRPLNHNILLLITKIFCHVFLIHVYFFTINIWMLCLMSVVDNSIKLKSSFSTCVCLWTEYCIRFPLGQGSCGPAHGVYLCKKHY